MAMALLTRADAALATKKASPDWPAQGYEVMLVLDTTGDSPGNPWAVFCPALDLVSAGRNPQDALDMIADIIHDALAYGATPAEPVDGKGMLGMYQELAAAGFPTANAVVRPAPYQGW